MTKEKDALPQIAFMPEIEGSEKMASLIDRIREIAGRDDQFPHALAAIEESLEHREHIAAGYAASNFSTDFAELPDDVDLGSFLYRFKSRDRT